MNMKAAYKATSFMFLPTLTFLIIVFCWFFNWSAFVAFVTEQSGWAGFFRILVLILEVALWAHFYLQYKEKFDKEDAANDVIKLLSGESNINELHKRRDLDKYDTERYLSIGDDRRAIIYSTKDPELFIIHSKITKK